MKSDFLVTAIIRAPHGVRGEIKIHSASGESDHLRSLTRAQLRTATWSREYEIEQIRGDIPNLILKLKGVDSPEEAAKLRGAQVLVTRDQSSPLADNEFYVGDLAGSTLIHDGHSVGIVLSVWQNGSYDMLEVQSAAGQVVHIPFIGQYFGDFSAESKQLEFTAPWLLE